MDNVNLGHFIVEGLITVLVTVLGFFLSKIYTKIETTYTKVISIETEFKNFKDNISYVANVKKDLTEKLEDIVILRRDQSSIWRNIDELKSRMRELS